MVSATNVSEGCSHSRTRCTTSGRSMPGNVAAHERSYKRVDQPPPNRRSVVGANVSVMAPQLAVLELAGESTPVKDLLRGVARSWRLLPMLAKQDYVARYRSAMLGLLWSVFLPLLQGAVLAVVFTHVVRIHSDAPSYPVFVLAGMTAWAYLSTSWSLGSTAIVDSSA